MLLHDSKDPLVAASNPVLKSGSWKVKDAVRSAESELAFQTIRGPPQFGRAGLGTTKSEGMPAKRTHQYRKLPLVYKIWRVQNLANLANFDKIRQIKYSPNLR